MQYVTVLLTTSGLSLLEHVSPLYSPDQGYQTHLAEEITQVFVKICILNHAEHHKNKQLLLCQKILCSVDRPSLYNLVNKTNLVHNILCIFCQFYL